MADDFRTETEAYKASKEVHNNLHDEGSFFYSPWQFIDFEVSAATLKTTYEEISIWSKEPAMIRPGFKVADNRVYIPNLFSKVCGVHNDIKQYRKEIKFLLKQPNILFYKGFPLSGAKKISFLDRNYFSTLDVGGFIDKNKLINSSFWRFKHLSSAAQSTIADRIIDFCWLYRFKNYEVCCSTDNEMVDKLFDFLKTFNFNVNIKGSAEDAAKIRIFEVINNIDASLIRLIEIFDYSQYIPKIIVYNNGNIFSKITFADAVKLMFMASMGIDVIIFNPAGYNDIEDFIEESYYDIHRLQNVAFNLPFRKGIFI